MELNQDRLNAFLGRAVVKLSLENGWTEEALRNCERMHIVTAKMCGGSETVRADLLEAAALYAAGRKVDIDTPLARVREADSKGDLAWALCFLAEVDLARGDRDMALRRAEEALAAAQSVGRESEAAIARVILGRRQQKISPDLSARALSRLKERKHGYSRARADV